MGLGPLTNAIKAKLPLNCGEKLRTFCEWLMRCSFSMFSLLVAKNYEFD